MSVSGLTAFCLQSVFNNKKQNSTSNEHQNIESEAYLILFDADFIFSKGILDHLALSKAESFLLSTAIHIDIKNALIFSLFGLFINRQVEEILYFYYGHLKETSSDFKI